MGLNGWRWRHPEQHPSFNTQARMGLNLAPTADVVVADDVSTRRPVWA